MAIKIPTFWATPLIVTVPLPVEVASALTAHAIPIEQVFVVSYRSVRDVAGVAVAQVASLNVTDPFFAKPQNTIMELATAGVMVAAVHVEAV